MLYLIGILIITGLVLFWISGRQRKSTGLPAGRVIYSDHDQWGKTETPLYDSTFNLTGKPDYLVENDQGIIPIEVKSRHLTAAPYDSHIYQLAAYCLLIDRSLGVRPPFGILHYLNKDIAVDYTRELEQSVKDLIREIRSQSRRRILKRSHRSPERCRRCGFNSVCDQALS